MSLLGMQYCSLISENLGWPQELLLVTWAVVSQTLAYCVLHWFAELEHQLHWSNVDLILKCIYI